jgi:hypothetical protein
MILHLGPPSSSSSPRSPLLSAARVISIAGRPRAPAGLRCPYLAPTRCPTPPSTARSAPAGRPLLSHVGPPVPSSCHAPEGHAGAARRPEPDPVTTLPLPLFYEAMHSYKARPKPHFLACFLFFLLAPPKLAPRSSSEFAATAPPRPNSSCPPLPHLLR